MKVHKIYKKIGETPLEALEKFRKKAKISPAAKLTYAGRLDPMASGVLLILEGATQKEREKYMGLDKEYEVEVLFGFETDSYDLLGIPKRAKGLGLRVEDIEKIIEKYHGLIKLPIPPYSSVPYKGKPLFEWARAGKKVKLPVREMEIKSIKLLGLTSLSADKLMSYIKTQIKKVKGDFRQEEILGAWEKVLCHPGIFQGNEKYPGSRTRKKLDSGSPPSLTSYAKASKVKKLWRTSRMHSAGMTQPQYPISNILISVSSGTYIRSIAHDLGRKLKIGAVIFSLNRTKVGKFKKSL